MKSLLDDWIRVERVTDNDGTEYFHARISLQRTRALSRIELQKWQGSTPNLVARTEAQAVKALEDDIINAVLDKLKR